MAKQSMDDKYSGIIKWVLFGMIGLLAVALMLKSQGL